MAFAEVQTVGSGVFKGLLPDDGDDVPGSSISLPKATSIGANAFVGCFYLHHIDLSSMSMNTVEAGLNGWGLNPATKHFQDQSYRTLTITCSDGTLYIENGMVGLNVHPINTEPEED